MQNKISIGEVAEKAILEKVAELAELLPEGLVALTEEERRALPMMGDKTVQFVYKALDLVAQNPVLLPAYIDLDEARKDFVAYNALNSILRALSPIVGILRDSAQLCGSEAYTAGLSIYNSARDAEHRGVPGAKKVVGELSPRFPGRGGSRPKPGIQ